MNKEVKVTYNLRTVDFESKTGVLSVRQEGNRSGHVLNVDLSGQLISRIKHSMKDSKARKYVGVDYTSTLLSPLFEENPFKLVRFNKEEGKPDFRLQLVTDKGFYFKQYTNAMNKRVDKIVFRHWKKSEFIRFWEVAVA